MCQLLALVMPLRHGHKSEPFKIRDYSKFYQQRSPKFTKFPKNLMMLYKTQVETFGARQIALGTRIHPRGASQSKCYWQH